MEGSRVVVVEDDERMATVLLRQLRAAGFEVSRVRSGAELSALCRAQAVDLVLLDLNLGAEDGMDLARGLIADTSAALIIVTGRDELQDRIDGFAAGADDYITKPFAPPELLARVRAVLRRHALAAAPSTLLQLGPYQLDTASGRLEHADRIAQLTAAEARILGVLLRQHGRAVSRAALSEREGLSPTDRSVDVHVANVRRKLRAAAMDDIIIWPVRGFGYRLRLEGEPEADG